MNLPAAAIGAALRPSLEMSGGGRFLFGGVARGLQRALNKAKRAAGIQSCRRHPMQRGADGSVITGVRTSPKTLTLSPLESSGGMFSGAREQVSSPAAAPFDRFRSLMAFILPVPVRVTLRGTRGIYGPA